MDTYKQKKEKEKLNIDCEEKDEGKREEGRKEGRTEGRNRVQFTDLCYCSLPVECLQEHEANYGD
jgi:hypothetical protein